MDLIAQELLNSWDRQQHILMNLANLVDETTRQAKPSKDGWSIDYHLCHIHESRYWWLSKVSPDDAKKLGDVFTEDGPEPLPIADLDEIRRQLDISARTIREVVEHLFESNATEAGPYSHPVHFLQHMVWHEGYHFGLLLLAMRNAGCEPIEDWQESHIWGIWRTPE